MATISWTLCVCGDVKKIFGVLAEETDTVLKLKKTIQHKSRIPSAEQTLYFQEKLMRDDQTLRSYPGLGDGAMIYLVRRPLSLRIYNLLEDTPTEFNVTLGHDIMDQQVTAMKKVICEIADYTNPDSCILLYAGEVLDDQTRVGDYSKIENGAKITLQKSPVTVKLERHGANFTATMPQGTNSKFANKWVSLKTGESESQVTCGAYSGLPSDEKDQQQLRNHCTISRQPGWILDVQTLDGSIISIHVPEKRNTPIVKLKEFIEKRTNVPTHHQKLTVGTTVLEDWDKDKNMMFIGDYPAIQNGSVVYIVQHNRHFRVIVVKQSRYRDSKEIINLHGKSDYSYQTTQLYVNTSEAERKCVLDKIRSCSNFREAILYDQYGQRKQSRRTFRGCYPHQMTTGDQYYTEPWPFDEIPVYYAEPNDRIELICDY